MTRNLLKSISKIMEESDTNNITIFTNHLKIDGTLFLPEGRCEECHDDFMTLENVLMCRLNDYCNCTDDECKCNDYVCFKYDWINVSINDIVAFSVVK